LNKGLIILRKYDKVTKGGKNKRVIFLCRQCKEKVDMNYTWYKKYVEKEQLCRNCQKKNKEK